MLLPPLCVIPITACCVLQRPMVRLKVDEELCVEWRGRWMKAIVTQVDCSLVGVSVEPYSISIGCQPLLFAV